LSSMGIDAPVPIDGHCFAEELGGSSKSFQLLGCVNTRIPKPLSVA
jgi:hypothetical protein